MQEASLRVRTTGSFSAAELTGDYSGSRYAFARRLGEASAPISSDTWIEVQPIFQDLWVGGEGELSWEEARPAIFHGWRASKRVLGRKVG
ncbi:hypothetical protein LYSHEL_02720 [Lysobacter helvus]|uniref:Uncharacterized protein n=2 Tax=Lysobacteraceae TaxID=32033 RepID=A0ABM7Q1X9_9GAMM|nr:MULTISPECIES: hypothetical protein [Lysobacter]BCT91248.1 hypothetical protein LYSCAS_02720 [Lysobacter caseinilyticus]BCT94401.1 hypothetical protein LYSHEL_02720 [Lysobacter helvus]